MVRTSEKTSDIGNGEMKSRLRQTRFEYGLVDVTATYTLRPDGMIRVENRGCKRNSPYDICKTANGHAKIPDPTQPGKSREVTVLWSVPLKRRPTLGMEK